MYCGMDGGRLRDWVRGAWRAADGLPRWIETGGGLAVPVYQGRMAVRLLCELWKLGVGDEVLAPAYNCGSELDPFIARGAKVLLYRVDSRAQIDREDLRRRITPQTRIIYVTHYFGWMHPLEDVRGWCRERGIRLVEDCALSLFSSDAAGRAGTAGDAAIYSFRKFLPVPDGGLLVVRDGDRGTGAADEAPGALIADLRGPAASRAIRDALPLLKAQVKRGMHSFGVRWGGKGGAGDAKQSPARPDMPEGYYVQQNEAVRGMSRWARGMLKGVAPDRVIERRRENYLALMDAVGSLRGVRLLHADLPAGACPFAAPVLVEERDRVAGALSARGILAYAFWKGYHRHLPWDEHAEACALKDGVVALPVHQRLTPGHMRFIARALKEVLEQGGAARSAVSAACEGWRAGHAARRRELSLARPAAGGGERT